MRPRIKALLICLVTSAAVVFTPVSADETAVFEEGAYTSAVIYPDRSTTPISPYIYGINDNNSIGGLTATVIKQRDAALSTYNWETNYSNPGTSGNNANDVSLVAGHPSYDWTTPALYTDDLVTRSGYFAIPFQLVTLQAMGLVAGDSSGIVSREDAAVRMIPVLFDKNEAYSLSPATTDKAVYMDEYVSYLTSKYGYASEGGIMGYFLDRAPDTWGDVFQNLGVSPEGPGDLSTRSAQLAYTVKGIDPSAMVFGPSTHTLQGSFYLCGKDTWLQLERESEYSWFPDLYLDRMRLESEKAGLRLLDSYDIHYYTEARTPQGINVIDGTDNFSNAYRMQAVRTLWDPDYVENSESVLLGRQFTPLIPTLRASIRTYYPDTRISFSEYDFGGGNHISGAIAEVEALGVFAENEIYMACLSPKTRWSYQREAMNLFTDYDNNGGSFGSELLDVKKEGDELSNVFSAFNSEDGRLNVIVTNQNMAQPREVSLRIASKKRVFELTDIYSLTSAAANIRSIGTEGAQITETGCTFTAEPLSVYLLSFQEQIDEPIESETLQSETGDAQETEMTGTVPAQTDTPRTAGPVQTVITTAETAYLPENTSPAEDTTLLVISAGTQEDVSVTSAPGSGVTSAQGTTLTELETDVTAAPEEEKKSAVPMPVRVIISLAAAATAAGVVYILIFDKK